MKELIELKIQNLESQKRKIDMEIERLEYLQHKRELQSIGYIKRFDKENK